MRPTPHPAAPFTKSHILSKPASCLRPLWLSGFAAHGAGQCGSFLGLAPPLGCWEGLL